MVCEIRNFARTHFGAVTRLAGSTVAVVILKERLNYHRRSLRNRTCKSTKIRIVIVTHDGERRKIP